MSLELCSLGPDFFFSSLLRRWRFDQEWLLFFFFFLASACSMSTNSCNTTSLLSKFFVCSTSCSRFPSGETISPLSTLDPPWCFEALSGDVVGREGDGHFSADPLSEKSKSVIDNFPTRGAKIKHLNLRNKLKSVEDQPHLWCKGRPYNLKVKRFWGYSDIYC